MEKEKLLDKYYTLASKVNQKENKIKHICKTWDELRKNYTDEEIKNMIDTSDKEKAALLEEANKVLEEYQAVLAQEDKTVKEIIAAKLIVKNNSEVNPDEKIITDGSHLVGRSKQKAELISEKNMLLNTLKSQVSKGEISLEEASLRKREIETAYSDKPKAHK